MSNFSMKLATSVAILGGIVASAVSASAALNLPTQSCSYSFNTNMKLNSRGANVMNLQKVLNGWSQTIVSASGAGSPGMETTTFGPATRAAVNKFQALHLTELGITAATGNVFAGTRGLLNEACSGSVSTTGTTLPAGCTSASGFSSVTGQSCASGAVTTTLPAGCTSASGFSPVTGASCATGAVVVVTGSSSPVTVTLASSQPTGMVVSGQASARLADFTFTGNGTVSNLKLMRTGVSSNDTLANVYLYDGATRLTDAASVLTDGTISFSNTSGLFVVNGSRTITVRSDIKSNVTGQAVGVSLTSVTAATVVTSFTNLNGNVLSVATIVDLSTGALSGSNVSGGNINAGRTGETVWMQDLAIGQRAAKLHAMTFKFIGSAPVDALANVTLYVDGAKVGNASMFGTDSLVSFDMTANPLVLNTGTHPVEVRADVVKGSSRDFKVSLENASDVRLEDRDVAGAFVTVTGTIPNSGTKFTVKEGNATVNLDSTFLATQVVGGSANAVIGTYVIKAYGEDIKIQKLIVAPVVSAATNTTATLADLGLKNLTIYVNGGAIGSSRDWTAGSLTAGTFANLGSTLTIPAGTSVTLTIKADLTSTAGANYVKGTVSANLTPITDGVQGMPSNVTSSLSGGTGRSLSIVNGAATYGNKAGFSAQVVGANSLTPVKIGSFALQASNADQIRVTGLKVLVTTTGSLNNITNLTVKDGITVIGDPVGSVSASNNFSVNMTLPISGSKTFDIYADLGSLADAETITASSSVTYSAITNSTSVTVGATGPLMTIGTAKIGTPTLSGTTPQSQYVVAGSNRLLAEYSIVAASSTAKVSEILVNLNGTGLTSVTIKSGGVSSSAKELTTGATSVLVDGLNLDVPNSPAGVPVEIWGTFATVGTGGVAANGTNTVQIQSIKYTSGNVASTTVVTSALSKEFTLMGSAPVTVKSVGTALNIGTGASTGNKIGSILVQISTNGAVDINSLPINIALPSGGSVTNKTLKVNGSIVSSASSTVSGFDFTGGYRINTNSPAVTFDVYADVSGVTTAGGATASVGSASAFTWGDINGGVLTGLDGTLIYNFGN